MSLSNTESFNGAAQPISMNSRRIKLLYIFRECRPQRISMHMEQILSWLNCTIESSVLIDRFAMQSSLLASSCYEFNLRILNWKWGLCSFNSLLNHELPLSAAVRSGVKPLVFIGLLTLAPLLISISAICRSPGNKYTILFGILAIFFSLLILIFTICSSNIYNNIMEKC